MKKLLLVLLLFSFRAQAECISMNHVQEIAATYEQFANDGKVCDTDTPDKFAILKTLLTLKTLNIAPSSGGYDDLSVPVIPDSWSNYLSLHVKKFMAGNADRCTADVLAYTNVRDHASIGVIYLCPAFRNQHGAGIYQNIAALLHEARHLEYNVDHVACQHGSDAGKENSCDESMAQKGSYAVSIQSLAKMAQPGARLHPVAQAVMTADAIATALERLNVAPKISREDKPVLFTTDGQLEVLGKDRLVSIAHGLPAGILVRNGKMLDLYPKGEVQPFQINTNLLLSENRNKQNGIMRAGAVWPTASRESILGIHHGKNFTVQLENSRWGAICDGQKTTVDMNQDTFKSIIYPDGYSSTQSSVVVLDNQDRWGRIQCDEHKQATLVWETPLYSQLSKVMKVGKEVYGITHGGRLVRLAMTNGRRAWTIVKPAQSIRLREIQALDWIRYIDQN